MPLALTRKSLLMTGIAIAVAGFGGVGLYFHFAQSHGLHSQHGLHGQHSQHGVNHAEHDEVNMPMLNGKDTTELEVNELKALFNNFEKLTRSVEMLPNGIKTITETDDQQLAAALIGHAVGMINRVAEQRDPEIPIQSPTLSPIFLGGKSIETTIETTEKGILVIQTSTDRQVVKALQKHALEVSDLAARGMEAVHEQMMQQLP